MPFSLATRLPDGRRATVPMRVEPDVAAGPVVTSLIAVGINGRGAAALRAVRGYDDATGVGSPFRYIQSFRR